MNNIIVSKRINILLSAWLALMAVLSVWLSIPAPAFTPLSGGVGLADLRLLLNRPVLKATVHLLFSLGEIWVFWLFFKGLKDHDRKLRQWMIVFFVLFMIRGLSSPLAYHQPVTRGCLSPLTPLVWVVVSVVNLMYNIVGCVLSYMFIKRFGGRLRRLGIVFLVMIGVSVVYGYVVYLLQMTYGADSGLFALSQLLLATVLQLALLWAIRTCFIPGWK